MSHTWRPLLLPYTITPLPTPKTTTPTMLELILRVLEGISIGAREALLWCAVFGTVFIPHCIEAIDSHFREDHLDGFHFARLAPDSKSLMPVEPASRTDAQAQQPAGIVASVLSRARARIEALDNRINWLKALITTPSRKRLMLAVFVAILVTLPFADYWIFHEELCLARHLLSFDRAWLKPLGITVSDVTASRVRLGMLSASGAALLFSAYRLLRTTMLQAFWIWTLWVHKPGTMFIVKDRQIEVEVKDANDEESAIAGE